MGFRTAAMVLFLLFYGIYFGKMLSQRKRGIKTDHLACNTENKRVFYTEIAVKTATIAAATVDFVNILLGIHSFSPMIRVFGLAVAALGVSVFGTAVFTMRDSWRAGIAESDKTEMVSSGIYRFSRNPAFLGFDLCYIGILTAFFSLPLLALTAAAVTALHFQILSEESYLITVFGDEYAEYKAKTARYFGIRAAK